MTSLKQLSRRRRVIELRCLGLTIPQIRDKLAEEGWKASEHTVWNDLHSEDVTEFIEELIRRQLADITLAEEPSLKMKYRDLLLDKLMPKRSEVKGEVEQSILIRGWGLDIAKGDNAKLQAAPEPSAVPP